MGLTCRTLRCRTQFDGPRAEPRRAARFVSHFDVRVPTRCEIALERATILFGTNDVLGTRAGLLLSFHEDVVDVRLAINDADDLRLRSFRRQVARQTITRQPPQATTSTPLSCTKWGWTTRG